MRAKQRPPSATWWSWPKTSAVTGPSRWRARTTEIPPPPSPVPLHKRRPPCAWPRTALAGGASAWTEALRWRWSRPLVGRSSSARTLAHRTPVTTARSSCVSTGPEPLSRCCRSPERGPRTRAWASGSCASLRRPPRIRSTRETVTINRGPTSATLRTHAVAQRDEGAASPSSTAIQLGRSPPTPATRPSSRWRPALTEASTSCRIAAPRCGSCTDRRALSFS